MPNQGRRPTRLIRSVWARTRVPRPQAALTAAGSDVLGEVQQVLTSLGEPHRLGALVQRSHPASADEAACDETLAARLALGLRLVERLAP